MTTHTDTSSVHWVCAHDLPRVQALFAALDLDQPGLGAVRDAVAAGDWPAACTALLAYYRACASGSWLRHAPVAPGDGTDAAAEKMADNIFALPGGEAVIPRLPDGTLDWGHVPTAAGGEEWVYGINRHDYMGELLAAYCATGNRRYAQALNDQLFDWTRIDRCPDDLEANGGKCPWGTILEVGHRVKAWPGVFYGLQNEDAFTPATRLLVLIRAFEHATFLRQHYSGGSNWVITEMAGLLSVATAWPELRDAAAWRELALRVIFDEMREQVYPDGTLRELTSNYQLAVLWHLDFVVATIRGAGLTLEPALSALLEQMWNYLAYAQGPNGHAPHNSDSDRPDSAGSQVIQPLLVTKPLRDAAAVYHRLDWIYIATNGAEGVQPPGLPSIMFPWAGQLVMRSGWDAEAQWGFFDIGPWGTLHQHNDMLHLSVTAYGRDLLVDSGRYTYKNYMAEYGTWRSYFVNSIGHNVILVDGRGQNNGPRLATAPVDAECAVVTPDYDFAIGTFTGGFADIAATAARLKAILYGQCTDADPWPENDTGATHTRAVLYLRGSGWLVVDRITTDRPRRITPLWHFHPACTVTREGSSVVTVDDGVGNLRIQPLGSLPWDIEFVRGREGPDFQGWYSPEMDVQLPNTCACYHAEIADTTTMAWLLLPGMGRVPATPVRELPAPAGAVYLQLELPTGPVEVAVRLDHDTPLSLSTGEAVDGYCTVWKL